MALLPTYILKLTLQHKALYCYLVLSSWILILLCGMYKYVGFDNESSTVKFPTTDVDPMGHFSVSRMGWSKKVVEACNPYSDIIVGGEGCLNSNYSLEGVLILIRHGDRGPLLHVHNISNVDCVGPPHPLYKSFETQIENITGTSTLSQLLGTFHGTPPLPGTECRLGLLTRIGASQLLNIGQILNGVYFEELRLNGSAIRDEVRVYSTKYRRTLQSSLAFLYSFLTKDHFHKVTLLEASSLAYCFDDCACPSAEIFQKKFAAETYRFLKANPDIVNLVRSSSSLVYEQQDLKISSDPHSLKDALLTYICHNAQFPCINDHCVQMHQVDLLFDYFEKETKKLGKSKNLSKVCLLRAYGLLKNVVSHLLMIVSEKKPKVVLYSGHDKTLSYLATALGISSDGVFAPYYASRLIIEVYKTHPLTSDSGPIGSDYFFRLLFNGKDLTKKIKFCKTAINGFSAFPRVPVKRRKSRVFNLCPIESIVRYLHEDYFSTFNATNIKDACST